MSLPFVRVVSDGELVTLPVCDACGLLVADGEAHDRFHRRQHQRDEWVRHFNAMDIAVTHHRRDKLKGVDTSDEVDERLWDARDRALRRAAGTLR